MALTATGRASSVSYNARVDAQNMSFSDIGRKEMQPKQKHNHNHNVVDF
jgi:hypothetical protein